MEALHTMMVKDQDVEEKKEKISFMSSAETQEEELDWEMPMTMLGTEAQFRESQALQAQDEKLGDKDPLAPRINPSSVGEHMAFFSSHKLLKTLSHPLIQTNTAATLKPTLTSLSKEEEVHLLSHPIGSGVEHSPRSVETPPPFQVTSML
ncbi:unnamed protein product [Caretta caretta]